MNKKILASILIAIIGVISVVAVIIIMQPNNNQDLIYPHFFQTQENQMFYYSSFAVDDNTNLYIGTSHKQYWQIEGGEWSEHYYIYSFNSQNTKRWEFKTNNSEMIKGGPAVHPDGLIIFVTEAMSSIYSSIPNATYNKLYALNIDDGTLNWSSNPLTGDITDDYWGSAGIHPAIDGEGNIYVQSQNYMGSYSSNGTLRWENTTAALKYSGSPSIYDDTVYFPSGDGSYQCIYAFHSNGSFKRVFKVDGADNCFNMISLDSEGKLYVGTDSNKFYIFNPNGALNSTFTILNSNAKVRGNSAIDSDGTIYFGTKNDANSEFYALNPDGTQKWKYNGALRDVYSSPTIADDGSLFFASEDRFIFQLNKENGVLIKKFALEDDVTWSSCTFDNDGTLYIGDMGGYLYAIEGGEIGLLSATWPCLGANFKRTRYISSE